MTLHTRLTRPHQPGNKKTYPLSKDREHDVQWSLCDLFVCQSSMSACWEWCQQASIGVFEVTYSLQGCLR